MKITGVRTIPYQLTMQRPIADANHPAGSDQMPGLAVFLDTDTGLSGIAMGGARDMIHTLVDGLLVGRIHAASSVTGTRWSTSFSSRGIAVPTPPPSPPSIRRCGI